MTEKKCLELEEKIISCEDELSEARREIDLLSSKLEEKAMSPGGSIVSSDIIIVKVNLLQYRYLGILTISRYLFALKLVCTFVMCAGTFISLVRVKGPHNVGDFSGRSGRSPGSLLTYLGLYICSNAPKEGFHGIRHVFFDQQVYFFLS